MTIRVPQTLSDTGWQAPNLLSVYGHANPLMEWYEGWVDHQIYVILSDHYSVAGPADLNFTVVLTLYRLQAATPLTDGQSAAIAGVGACSVQPWLPAGKEVVCLAGKSPSVAVDVAGTPDRASSIAPYRGVFRVSPIFTLSASFDRLPAEYPLVITTKRPIAHLRRTLELHQARLDGKQ